MSTFVFGDIHGCCQQLRTLLDAISPNTDDTLVFLGDVLDRGLDSKGVIDTIWMYEKHCHVITLMGNHEQMLLDAYYDAHYLNFWLRFGGNKTLQSFGLTSDLAGLLALPKPYIHWLKNTKNYHETDSFILTHAAPDPYLMLSQQSEQELRWRVINPDDPPHLSGKTIICGHTTQKDGTIYQQQGLIGIDTYAHGGGYLTALEISTSQPKPLTAWQLSANLNLHKQTINPC